MSSFLKKRRARYTRVLLQEHDCVMWQVIYSRTFLKELAKLPEDVRGRVEEVVFGEAIKQDPWFGGRVEKMVVIITRCVSAIIGWV